MDITPYLEPRIAPRAIFDELPERSTRVRYMVPTEDGDWRAVTFGAHAKEIRQIGMWISKQIRTQDRAAIFAPNSVTWMAAALGIQAAGGVMVPVYASSTADQLAYIVEHGDVKVLFVDTNALMVRAIEALPQMPRLERIVLMSGALPEGDPAGGKLVSIEQVRAEGQELDAADPEAFIKMMCSVDLEQPGMMLYTSGTSGPPKGVPLTHLNVASNGADWLRCNAPLVEKGAIDLLWLPMSHVFGFGEAGIGNSFGWTSYMINPKQVMSQLPVVRPSVLFSVPSVWEKIAIATAQAGDAEAQKARFEELTGGNLSFCLSGGAGLKREVKELFKAQGLVIIEGYGLTECSPTLTLNRPGDYRFDSVGKPLPSVELKLAEDGEILAKGPNVFGGYHKNPEATAEAFTEDGWFKTGDVGQWTDDGFLRIVDRKKDILVTAGGKNIAPANIERVFADDPYIDHLIVYGDSKKYLVAGAWMNEEAVKEKLGEGADAAAIQAFAWERVTKANLELPKHETIKKVAVMSPALSVEGGLLTPTLKPKRKAIYKAFKDAFEELYG